MQIIVCHEKHGEQYLDASTPEAWAKSALKILTERFEQGYWYYDPRQEKNEFSLNLRKEEEEEAALNLSDEDLKKLPDAAIQVILKARKRLRLSRVREEAEVRQYEAIKQVVEDQDTSLVTIGRNRFERQVPKAWRLLEERSDHEYEQVVLEDVWTGEDES